MENRIKEEPLLLGNKLDLVDSQSYQSAHMQKEQAIEELRKQGYRITKQRKILIDIILGQNCSCCKEVYILAIKKDPGIGIATVYRTIDALEKIGALKRSAAYELCEHNNKVCNCCVVRLDDDTTIQVEYSLIEKMIEQGIQECGLNGGRKVKSITLIQSEPVR